MKPLFQYDTDRPPCIKCGFPCSPRSDGAMACINRKCDDAVSTLHGLIDQARELVR
jgi:hypothetical protein